MVDGTGIRILLSGGGTGGHIYPALAIAEAIKKQRNDVSLLFVGAKGRMEERIVPAEGYNIKTIWISGASRQQMLKNVLLPLKVVVSMLQSYIIIRRFSPHAVIGTGGFVCGPVVYAAVKVGIPTFLHESNSYPGFTTRLLAHRVARVFTGFESTSNYLRRKDNMEYVGTPIRTAMGGIAKTDGVGFFGLSSEKKTVLVFGGSLGAASINKAVAALVRELEKNDIQLIWQTGDHEYSKFEPLVRGKRGMWIGKYIHSMQHAYAASDLVVCRAGAMTVAELVQTSKPAILIPYPFAAEDHQTYNARYLESMGAAVLLPDDSVYANLREAVLYLAQDDQKLAEMSGAYMAFKRPHAGERIASEILATVH